MFERFTDRARRVVVLAQDEARMLNHNYIGTEHLLLGLIHEGEGVAAKALTSLGISLEAVRHQVEEIIGQGPASPSGHIPFTPRAKKVLELSLREALQLGHNYIGTEHILLGLLREGDGVAAQVLVGLGADLNRVRHQVIYLVHTGPKGGRPTRIATGEASAESRVLRISGERWIGELQDTLAKMTQRIEAIERVLGMTERPPAAADHPAESPAPPRAPEPRTAPRAPDRPAKPPASPDVAKPPASPDVAKPPAGARAADHPAEPPVRPDRSDPPASPGESDPPAVPGAADRPADPPTPPDGTAATGD
jgi:Clp amino terminal domain, pathogenicity island component